MGPLGLLYIWAYLIYEIIGTFFISFLCPSIRMFSQMSKLAFPYETEWLMGPLTLMVRLVLINIGVLLRVVH